MLGYININQKELSDESKKIYQAYYCGLCRKLKETAGTKGQMLLNYDLTFLIVLLTGLYEPQDEKLEFTCALHPTKRRNSLVNEVTAYAADMNIMLSYQNFEDDCKDGHSYTKKAFTKILGKDYERIMKKYPRQVKAVETYMEQLGIAEKSKETNVDVIAGLTGTMLGEIFAWKEDMWADELRYMGFYMGKFVYLMSSYETVECDRKKNSFNPLISVSDQNGKDFDTLCRLMLTTMVSECAKSFERLPILLHADIIRNILYSGVWCKYEYNQLKKQKKSTNPAKKTRKIAGMEIKE